MASRNGGDRPIRCDQLSKDMPDNTANHPSRLHTVSLRNICTGSVAFSAGKAGVFSVKAVTRQRQAA